MAIFEFLMILQSIIIGLGIAEILTGVARTLRVGRARELGWIHWSLVLLIFLALLQVFWESWSLNRIDTWTFPAMIMMLTAPIVLHLIAHLMFPLERDAISPEDHYFKHYRLIWSLGLLGIVVNTGYRPIAFGQDFLVVDNLSMVPQVLMCCVLVYTGNRRVHQVLLPLGALAVVWDTLAITYLIR